MTAELELRPFTGRPRRDANGTPLSVRLSRSIDYRGPEGCWEWHGSRKPDGYGQINVGGSIRGAHRVVYEQLVGPIPAGLHIDHLCRVRHCVNPAHLEPVTPRENYLRGVSPAARNAAATHCKRGHEFTAENTHVWNGHRTCRACTRLTYRARMAARGPLPVATHCGHGHEYTPETTYVWNGVRSCRTCGNERTRRYKARVRSARALVAS